MVEALTALSQATKMFYSQDGLKMESQIIRELKIYGGLEKIFELVLVEKGVIHDYSITVLSSFSLPLLDSYS